MLLAHISDVPGHSMHPALLYRGSAIDHLFLLRAMALTSFVHAYTVLSVV